MQKGDKGLPSIILAAPGLLVKMLITLEPHILLKFVYIYILTLSRHRYSTRLCHAKCPSDHFFHKYGETLSQNPPNINFFMDQQYWRLIRE